MVISEKCLNKFWKNVNKHGPIPQHVPELGNCWQWIAGTSSGRYGKLRIGPKHYSSHRISFMIHNPSSEINGKFICHKCDNMRCVNPDHLFIGDSLSNVRDCILKKRRAVLVPPVMLGDSNPSTKISDDDVTKIIESCESNSSLAKKHGVSIATISRIRSGIRSVSKNARCNKG